MPKPPLVRTYTTKPEQVLALQLTSENIHDAALWTGGQVIEEGKASDPSDVFLGLRLPTVDWVVTIARPGEYVYLVSETGRFHRAAPAGFEEKYQPTAGVTLRVQEHR